MTTYRFMRFPGGKPKAVTLSYDDGCPQDERLGEIIDRYGLKCTFNLNSAFLLERESGAAAIARAKGFLENGHEVAVHGAHHLANGIMNPIDGIRDVLQCREELEQIFGRIIRGMAYPDSGIGRFTDGNTYQTVKNYLQALGIVYARIVGGENDRFDLPADWLSWTPTIHHAHPDVLSYVDKFVASKPNDGYYADRYPRLFYLWGHSYEFDEQNNWELMETIGQRLGGMEDTWYATNIEVYEYVTAYRSLVRSADGKRMYNPTVTPVWFFQNSRNYCVNPGETLVME